MLNQRSVNHHTPVIDALIEVVVVPLEGRHREALQFVPYIPLCPDILQTVRFEALPLSGSVQRKVARPAAVGCCGLTGLAEILDQVFTRLVFLFSCLQHNSRLFQCERERQARRPHHGTAPVIRGQCSPQHLPDTRSLECSVPGRLDDGRIVDSFKHFRWYSFPACNIHNFHLIIVKRIGEKQDVEVPLDVAVNAALA